MRVRLDNVTTNYFSYPVGGSRENKRLRTKVDHDVLLRLCVGDAYREGVSFSLHCLLSLLISRITLSM